MLANITKNSDADMEAKYRDGTLQNPSDRETVMNSFLYFYYPNRPNLVVNAILSGLHTRSDNLVIRATFDFLISHIEIDSDFLEKEERVRLVEGTLLTLMVRDFASHKKFFNWFLAHLDDEEEVSKDDPAV